MASGALGVNVEERLDGVGQDEDPSVVVEDLDAVDEFDFDVLKFDYYCGAFDFFALPMIASRSRI